MSRLLRTIEWSLWFASAASAGELVLWTWRTYVGSGVIAAQAYWMIPVGYVAIMCAAGLLAALAALRQPWAPYRARVAFVCAGLALGGWLFMFGGLHRYAAAVLALGGAVQIARSVAGHASWWDRWIRRTGAVVLPVTALFVGVFLIRPVWSERQATAALPPAQQDSPNVVLLVLDTVRAQSLSVYGYTRDTTPKLAGRAAGGVVFEHAYATAPWTLPSHATMFTGRYPHEFTASWQTPLGRNWPTLAESFARHGYLTAGFVANIKYGAQEFGLARGFAHYEDRQASVQTVMNATSIGRMVTRTLHLMPGGSQDGFGLKDAGTIRRDFRQWREGRDASRPYFAFLNFADAHTPYRVPRTFTRRFSAGELAHDLWSRPLDAWTPPDIDRFRNAYDDALAYLDDEVDALLGELDTDTARPTLVVIVADHGEQFGERGLLEHANSLFAPLLHVPLVVLGRGLVPAGLRVAQPVSLRDLAATIGDLARLPDAAQFPGRSLAGRWREPGAGEEGPVYAEVEQSTSAYPDSYPSRKGPLKTVILNGLQYIRTEGTGVEELYDVRSDTGPDLAREQPDVVARYRDLIAGVLEQPGRQAGAGAR